MKRYWVSVPAYTIYVAVNTINDIVDIAPIARWAIGKRFDTLIEYLKRRFKDVQVEEI